MAALTLTQAVTMTSREIAELTGSTHDSVLKTVRRLVAEGVVSPDDTPYVNSQNGQTYPQFLLSFRDTMVVVSGYNSELRAKIIDRWQELETAQAPKLPQTMAQALRLAADQAEQLEAQAIQLQAQQPARRARAITKVESLAEQLATALASMKAAA